MKQEGWIKFICKHKLLVRSPLINMLIGNILSEKYSLEVYF